MKRSSNSHNTSAVREDFKWNKSESYSKSNSGTKITNSPDKQFKKLDNALDFFIQAKDNSQVISGAPERLTFSNSNQNPPVIQRQLTPEKTESSEGKLLKDDFFNKNMHSPFSCERSKYSQPKQKIQGLSFQHSEETQEDLQLYSTFGVTQPKRKHKKVKSST